MSHTPDDRPPPPDDRPPATRTFGERPFTPHEDAVTDRLRAEGWSYDRIAAVLGRVSGPSIRARHEKRQHRAREAERRAVRSANAKKRHCLRCSVAFRSTHSGHRMCNECRRVGTSPFEPDIAPLAVQEWRFARKRDE